MCHCKWRKVSITEDICQILFSFMLNRGFRKYSMNLPESNSLSENENVSEKLWSISYKPYMKILFQESPEEEIWTIRFRPEEEKMDHHSPVQNEKKHQEQFENSRQLMNQDWPSFLGPAQRCISGLSKGPAVFLVVFTTEDFMAPCTNAQVSQSLYSRSIASKLEKERKGRMKWCLVEKI